MRSMKDPDVCVIDRPEMQGMNASSWRGASRTERFLINNPPGRGGLADRRSQIRANEFMRRINKSLNHFRARYTGRVSR